MKLSLIVAMADNHVIGHNNRLPWHLPADLKHFRAITLGKPVLMGRKTWESIGRPLPGRTNIVITRNADYLAADCVVVHSLDEALRAAGSAAEVMVIGGAELYRQALPQADTLYLTLVRTLRDAILAGEFENVRSAILHRLAHRPTVTLAARAARCPAYRLSVPPRRPRSSGTRVRCAPVARHGPE